MARDLKKIYNADTLLAAEGALEEVAPDGNAGGRGEAAVFVAFGRDGFELALELTVKATLAHRRVAEVPTTWRDRTAGHSNFKMRKWLPHYLHWYRVAFVGRFSRRRGEASGDRTTP